MKKDTKKKKPTMQTPVGKKKKAAVGYTAPPNPTLLTEPQ